jgi:hypothetical protein
VVVAAQNVERRAIGQLTTARICTYRGAAAEAGERANGAVLGALAPRGPMRACE